MPVKVSFTRVKDRRTQEVSSGALDLGFESGVGGWTAGANTTITRVTTPVQAGAGSCQLTSIAAGDISVSSAAGTLGILVVAGLSYQFDIYVATSGTGRLTEASIDWYSTTGAFLSTSVGSSSTNSTIFGTRSVTATAPATAKYAALRVTVHGTGIAGAIHYVDSASFGLAQAPVSPSETVLVDSDMEGYTVSSPITNADMWDAIGHQNGNQTTFARTSLVSVGAPRGKVINQHFTAGLFGTADGIAMAVPLVQSVDEAYIEYMVRFTGTDWTSTTATGSWGGGGKLPGLGGILPSAGISPPTGGNPDPRGWTSRFMWRTPMFSSRVAPKSNEMVSYVYDPTQGNPGNLTYGQDRWSGKAFVLNQWHTIKQYHKMNTINVEGTSGNADGIHRMYFDGVLCFENLAQVYRIYETAKITHLMYSNFYGGATEEWGPDTDSDIQFDNLKVTAVLAAA